VVALKVNTKDGASEDFQIESFPVARDFGAFSP
jgi:hypothetical protein